MEQSPLEYESRRTEFPPSRKPELGVALWFGGVSCLLAIFPFTQTCVSVLGIPIALLIAPAGAWTAIASLRRQQSYSDHAVSVFALLLNLVGAAGAGYWIWFLYEAWLGPNKIRC